LFSAAFMYQDSQGLAVTTDSAAAIAPLNRFIDQALSYGRDAEVAIAQALEADPTCALAHAYAAAYWLSQENSAAAAQAKPHLIEMKQYLKRVTRREWWYIQAIAAWAEGNISQAIALHEALAQHYPEDLISMQQGQYHYFYQGRSQKLLAIAQRVLPANRENHYLYGMLAFGLEQCGDERGAEAWAHRAVELHRFDPWAHHAIAHVLHSQGRIQDGIDWMEAHADTWDACNSMLYTHNWWHIALYYLAQGEFSKVLQLYDQRVWGGATPGAPKDQVGAIATLMRLELQGVEVGDRWQTLIPWLHPRIHEHALAFQDLHYIYALARSGRQDWVAEMLQSLHHHGQSSPEKSLWAEVVLPAAQGIAACAVEDWLTAVTSLVPILPRLVYLGGSRTQQELFTQLAHRAVGQLERWSSRKVLSLPRRSPAA
jgi:tetratricopeptide (TPR) repeat protein